MSGTDESTRARWLSIAEKCRPVLLSVPMDPVGLVAIKQDGASFQGWRANPVSGMSGLYDHVLQNGDSFVLDFGQHLVGYVTLSLRSVKGKVDGPLRFRLTFGEIPTEVVESIDPLNTSGISRAWIQDEVITLDDLSQPISLPRRYSFQYMRITLLASSPYFQPQLTRAFVSAVSSAGSFELPSVPVGMPDHLAVLDQISLRTLRDCMQTVFEDGPKRDRRLWMGDLRLQALVNYQSFHQNDLVKRCLYLFAALSRADGLVTADIYEHPVPTAGDVAIIDYSLLFVSALCDYAKVTKDFATAADLWPVVSRQIEIGMSALDANQVFQLERSPCGPFVDWAPILDKQATLHAVLLYACSSGAELALLLGLAENARDLRRQCDVLRHAALRMRDPQTGFFFSGQSRQISWSTQAWMVLAGAVEPAEGARLLTGVMDHPDAVKPGGPYLYHYMVEALFVCGLPDVATRLMNSYWGAMAALGANTFWEVFDAQDHRFSPSVCNSPLLNSYCHAWSSTPAYLIRRYLGYQ
jgi:alpha-L-rhamnosidase